MGKEVPVINLAHDQLKMHDIMLAARLEHDRLRGKKINTPILFVSPEDYKKLKK